jgi:hypothetical protein
LKEEALDHTLRRTRFGRGYGPVVRQTKEWMNKLKFTKLHKFQLIIRRLLWMTILSLPLYFYNNGMSHLKMK